MNSTPLQATLIVDRDFVLGPVDSKIFGSFIEHLGRAVYTGVFEPGHPSADSDGFRGDVLDLIRELNVSIVRYPGGNFVSGFNWEDSIGPQGGRPRRLDLAWMSTESNQFGLNEFMTWVRKAGIEPMMALNLGTRGPSEARDLIEYCNHPGGTRWSDLRRTHGFSEAHRIKYWCLGNEMDGPWQIGHKTASEYGRIACETAKILKWVDPSVSLVASGSSGHAMNTFGTWELEVLHHTLEHVDFISLHMYNGNVMDDLTHYLPLSDEMDDFIRETVSLCDAAAAKQKSRKKIMLSFDEWNAWYHDQESLKWLRGEKSSLTQAKWDEAPPLLEDHYNMADALLVGSMLITLLNNADRVKIACLAQLVNVIAPIMTRPGGPAWRQTIFYPFLHGSRFGRGVSLRPVIRSPLFDTRHRQGSPYLTASAIHHPDKNELVIFAVNRSVDQSLQLTGDLRSLEADSVIEWLSLSHSDTKAINGPENPAQVIPVSRTEARLETGRLSALLNPLSWNVIRLKTSK
ncbi:MAG: alpha-N-arabinofuranosidase [Verrucomicrobiae bacterium]|nr:alpha-N-arabinofuranosidase [Verrucomicrobiae bacterium]